MPFRQRASFGRNRRRSLGTIVDSNKNEVNGVVAITASANFANVIALSVDSALNSVAVQVTRGCHIYRFWLEFWYYGLSASETNDIFDAYIIKNPGSNLTPPNPGTTGTSNEKKFIFKEWKGLAGQKSTGGQPYMWRGWVKVPKVYQRFGADDIMNFVVRSPTTGNLCFKIIYKWFK